METPGVLLACIFGALFYCLLLIKDLLIINRMLARTLLVMALSLFLLRSFYLVSSTGASGFALLLAFFIAALFALMLDNLIIVRMATHETLVFSDPSNLSSPSTIAGPSNPLTTTHPSFSATASRRLIGFLAFVLISQCLIIVLFLPLDFTYQSVIVFMVAALMIDLIPNYVVGIFPQEKMRLATVTFFALFVIVLASAKWGL